MGIDVNQFLNQININLDEIHIEKYLCPTNTNLNKRAGWIGYRLWNAIKHIFSRSDWDIEKRKLISQISNSSSSKETVRAEAELLLRIKIDKIKESLIGMEDIAPLVSLDKMQGWTSEWDSPIDHTPYDEMHIERAKTILEEVKTRLNEKMNNNLAEKLYDAPFLSNIGGPDQESIFFSNSEEDNQKLLNALVGLLKKEGFDATAFKLPPNYTSYSKLSFGFKNKNQQNMIDKVLEQIETTVRTSLDQNPSSTKIYIPFATYVKIPHSSYDLSNNDKKKIAETAVTKLKNLGYNAEYSESTFSLIINR